MGIEKKALQYTIPYITTLYRIDLLHYQNAEKQNTLFGQTDGQTLIIEKLPFCCTEY